MTVAFEIQKSAGRRLGCALSSELKPRSLHRGTRTPAAGAVLAAHPLGTSGKYRKTKATAVPTHVCGPGTPSQEGSLPPSAFMHALSFWIPSLHRQPFTDSFPFAGKS